MVTREGLKRAAQANEITKKWVCKKLGKGGLMRSQGLTRNKAFNQEVQLLACSKTGSA